MNALTGFLSPVGRGVGGVAGALYQAGREAIDQVIANILPFMAFISLVIGIILYTGIGTALANLLDSFHPGERAGIHVGMIFWMAHFFGELPPGQDHIHQIVFIVLSLVSLLISASEFFSRGQQVY